MQVIDLTPNVRAALRDRGITERALRAVFDQEPCESPALLAVSAFLRSDSTILALAGANAAGKTTAASWACTGVCGQPLGLFVRLQDLLADGQFGPSVRACSEADLLVIDDIGSAHFAASGFTSSMLDGVVDAVYGRCGKLILTSDLGWADLQRLLSRRVRSRLVDAGTVASDLGPRHTKQGPRIASERDIGALSRWVL